MPAQHGAGLSRAHRAKWRSVILLAFVLTLAEILVERTSVDFRGAVRPCVVGRSCSAGLVR